MKPMIMFSTLLLLASAALGCTSKAESPSTAKESREATASNVIKETKEAAQALWDYTFAQRAQFVARVNGELGDVQKELDRLSARAVDANTKAAYDKARERWALAKSQLALAESATEATWQDARGNVKRAHEDLRDSVASARQWLSDKIAP
jgi:hypothetical protein